MSVNYSIQGQTTRQDTVRHSQLTDILTSKQLDNCTQQFQLRNILCVASHELSLIKLVFVEWVTWAVVLYIITNIYSYHFNILGDTNGSYYTADFIYWEKLAFMVYVLIHKRSVGDLDAICF